MGDVLDTIWSVFPDGAGLLLSVAGLALFVLFLVYWVLYRSSPSTRGPSHAAPGRLTKPGRKASGSKSEDVTQAIEYDPERQRTFAIMSDLRADNKTLRKRVAHLSNMNTLLAPLMKELSSISEQRRMGPIVLRVLARIFNPSQAVVFFREENRDELVLVAQMGVEGVEEGFRMKIGEGFAGIVAQKKVVLTATDVKYESNLVRQRVEQAEPEAFRTQIAVPILYRGEALGVLCIGGCGEVSPDMETLCVLISDMVALAVSNYQQYRKIQMLANSDQLTQIYNKGYFLEKCGPALSEARRMGVPASILMIDVDNFKDYNDTCGHLAGDQVLRELSSILRREVREGDILARYGGEEFILLLHGVGAKEALQAAERIRGMVAAHHFMNEEKQPLGSITVSAGVASLPEHGPGTVQLIEAADQALYAAKNGGRNRVRAAPHRSAGSEAWEIVES